MIPAELTVQIPGLAQLCNALPSELDLTSQSDLDTVIDTAESLLRETSDPTRLGEIESAAAKGVASGAIPIALAVAAKLALSKSLVSQIEKPGFVSVVFAVYKEHNRIKPPEEHPHGEDFLVRKVAQLNWLFDGSPHLDWELLVVDDGCPKNSGRIAEEIIKINGLENIVRVLFLESAIRDGLPVAAGLETPADSQKGGSILYGMWQALQTMRESHVVLYTDADLSTHLGQIGLLLDPLQSGAAAAIGSRRDPASVVVKKGGRNSRGKLFIYLWKRLISTLPNVIDTQCAFKAFRADIARKILIPAIERKFAFDIELLVKTSNQNAGDIVPVPVAWIDSEAASTTTDLEPYLPMLQSVVRMSREYLPENSESDQFAKFIDSLTPETWDTLTDNVPPEIAEQEPFQLGSASHVSVEALNRAASVSE